jgi:hypothetical protein
MKNLITGTSELKAALTDNKIGSGDTGSIR